MAGPDATFWQNLFEAGTTPWDRGAVHPQLQAWLDEGRYPQDGLILVPGCGNGYEVEALARAGRRVLGVDYAPAAVQTVQQRLDALRTELPEHRGEVAQADLLRWQPPEPLDVVHDQTCLCALHPDLWVAYANRLADWVRPGGWLCMLFVQIQRPNAAQGMIEGPPYHCDINAMRALFPADLWVWPKPPYAQAARKPGFPAAELIVVLQRRQTPEG